MMTDSGEYFVDAAALQHDVATFTSWRDELDTMADALPLDLPVASFTLLPGASDVHARLIATATALHDYLNDGAAELSAVADKLEATLRIYTEAEDASADDVARVSRELDSL